MLGGKKIALTLGSSLFAIYLYNQNKSLKLKANQPTALAFQAKEPEKLGFKAALAFAKNANCQTDEPSAEVSAYLESLNTVVQ